MTGDDATPSGSPTPNADAVGVDLLSGAGNEPASKPAKAKAKAAAPADDDTPADKATSKK